MTCKQRSWSWRKWKFSRCGLRLCSSSFFENEACLEVTQTLTYAGSHTHHYHEDLIETGALKWQRFISHCTMCFTLLQLMQNLKELHETSFPMMELMKVPGTDFKIPYSNNCMWDLSWAWPTWRSTAVTCMERPVPTAVWPEIHTVPGMANPVPDIQTPKRGQDLDNTDQSHV